MPALTATWSISARKTIAASPGPKSSICPGKWSSSAAGSPRASKPLPHGRGSDWCIATPIRAATVRERFPDEPHIFMIRRYARGVKTHLSPAPVDTHTLKRSDFEIPGKDLHHVTPLRTRERAALSRSRFRPRIRPGQERETGVRPRRSRPPEDRRRVHQAHQGVPARPAYYHRAGGPHARVRYRPVAPQIPRTH